jgi:hypothetical protein
MEDKDPNDPWSPQWAKQVANISGGTEKGLDHCLRLKQEAGFDFADMKPAFVDGLHREMAKVNVPQHERMRVISLLESATHLGGIKGYVERMGRRRSAAPARKHPARPRSRRGRPPKQTPSTQPN